MRKNNLLKGIFFTSFASTFWGIPQPLIFNQIKYIPAIEVVSHRALWSFIFLFLIITFIGRIKDFFLIFYSYKILVILSISAILISINWIGFIFAVSFNRIQDASMGYFLTPLVSISLGYFFLNEKISKAKFISILLMLSAIFFLIISLKTLPILAIVIGTSWGLYGLLKKKINISSEIGLLYESFLISILALPYIIYIDYINLGFFLNESTNTNYLLILTGAITVFPLFLFNQGVKFITLGFAGVIFYLAPTLHFFTSVFILDETLSLSKLIAFIIIWIGVLIFIIDVLRNENKSIENNTQ